MPRAPHPGRALVVPPELQFPLVHYLTMNISRYLLHTASIPTFKNLQDEFLGLLVEFEILTVDLVDEEGIGNDNGGFLEIDEEEVVDEGIGDEDGFLEIELVDEGIGNEDGFVDIGEDEEMVDEGIGNEDGFLEIAEDEELLLMMNMENDDELVWRGKRGASESAIDGLKKEKFECGFDGDETSSTTCMVCLDDISVGIEFTSLLCSHVFHYLCMVKWLEESNDCPKNHYDMEVTN